MKKLLFLLTAAMVAMSVTAAPVDQATAMRKAKSYLVNELFAGKLMSFSSQTHCQPSRLLFAPGIAYSSNPFELVKDHLLTAY